MELRSFSDLVRLERVFGDALAERGGGSDASNFSRAGRGLIVVSRPTAVPRPSWIFLIVVLAGLLISRESRRPGPIGGLDRAFFDWLGANTRANKGPAAGGVTLVEIDDAVLESPGRWPLAPLDYALFLQAVQRFDPAVIAIEPVANWPRPQPGNEEILVQQALTAPKLLLSVQLGSAAGAKDVAPLPTLEHFSGDPAGVPQFPEVVEGPNARILPLAVCGVANLPAPGAPTREIPLLFRRRTEVVPSFTLQALGLWFQAAPGEISVTAGETARFGDHHRIALDRAGRALLDVSAYRQVNRIELDDLLLSASGENVAAPAKRIKGGLVILGRVDRAAQVYSLPGGAHASAAEVMAWAAASLRENPMLRRASLAWDAGLTLIVAVLAPVLLRIGQGRAAAIASGALAAYALAALCAFEIASLWLPFGLPIGLAVVIFAARLLQPRVSSS